MPGKLFVFFVQEKSAPGLINRRPIFQDAHMENMFDVLEIIKEFMFDFKRVINIIIIINPVAEYS